MSRQASSGQATRLDTRSPTFWVTMVRGAFAILLGLSLFIQPDKTRGMLVTFMAEQ
jgi:hypothetical protein